MSNTYSLGKYGKFGNIDFEKLRSGITKKDLDIEANTVLSNIFDSIDNGGGEGGKSKGNGRLERNELQAFINRIKELAGNDKLSKREAKNYEVDGEKLGKNKEELLVFLNKLAELTKGVQQITSGNGAEIVTFVDGHTEQILANGNKIITKKQDGKTVTTTVDEDDNVLEETVEDENFVTTTKNNPGTHKKQEVVTKNKNSKTTTTIKYEDDDETPKTKEEVADNTTTQFKYDKETKKYVPISSDTTTTVNGKKRVEHTEYDQEKSTEENRTVKSVSVLEDGKLISKTKGNKTVEYDGNGNTFVIVQPDERDAGKIAEKFGCDKEKLIQINGNKVRFEVGEKIKIPSQLEPDAPELENRLSSDEVVKKFEDEQEAKRKAEEEARAAKKRAAQEAREKAKTRGSQGRGSTGGTSRTEGSSRTGGSSGTTPKTEVKTRKKYDTATIKKEAGQLATALHNQISGASLNDKTVGLLRTVTKENVAFVVSEYQSKYGVSLAKDIDDEWGLDINTVKEHICKKLVAQAKSLGVTGIYYGDYQKINDVNQLQNWINNAAAKIRTAMANATEKYTVTEGEKPQMTAGEKQVQKQSAQQIVNKLKAGIGTIYNSHDDMKVALDRIDSKEVLDEVNRLLKSEGYGSGTKFDEKDKNLYSPIEEFLYRHFTRGADKNRTLGYFKTNDILEEYVNKWIEKGVIRSNEAVNAQARMAARVIIESCDGPGTNYSKLHKGIRLIKSPAGQNSNAARKVYKEVDRIVGQHRVYGSGQVFGSLKAYLGDEWSYNESDAKYLKGILAENEVIQGKERTDAIADLAQDAVENAGTDIDALKQAIKAIRTPEDRKAVEAKLEEYCKKKGIHKHLKGQAALQAILYDECDTFMGLHRDHKEIRKFNEMLISQGAYGDKNSPEVIALRAEQAVLQILEGDYDNVMDAVQQIKDPKVLAKVNYYLQNNIINGKKYANLQDFLNKKFGTNSTDNDLVMAELAGNNLIGDEKAAEVAFRLINNSDFNKRAMGLKAIRSEKAAKLVDAKLKERGTSLQKVIEKFNKEKAEYKTKSDIWDGLAYVLGSIAEHISDEYGKNTDSSDNMYIEAATARQIPPEKAQAYKMTIETFEQNLEKMKADYQEALDGQGTVSDAVNRFCGIWNIGTTRDEIEARIEHDTETLRLLKLAAKGKLAKMVNGKSVAVSFEDVFKERQSAHISANGTSISSIGNAIKPKEVTEFDPVKVEKVANKAETIGAMDCVKDLISVSWDELDSAEKSKDKKRLAASIYNTLSKLSRLVGTNLSLADYGYQINSAGIVVDSKGKEVSVSDLQAIVNQLKQGLSDLSKDVLGQAIPLNAGANQVSNMLEGAYGKKMEAFKQEYRDAFGQNAPDSVIESYVSTINTGKTIVNFGAIIGAAVLAPFTGGGSLAVFGAVAGVSMGLNALEKSTDADGYTNMEWTSDAEQAIWDGALAALGMKVGMFAEVSIVPAAFSRYSSFCSKLFANPIHANKAAVLMARAEAGGVEIFSDSVQSYVQMYAQEGNIDSDAFWQGFAMSLIGNTAGHIHGARSDIKGQKALDAPKRKELPPPSDSKPSETPQQPRQIDSDGQNPRHIDGNSDAGKVGGEAKEEPKSCEEMSDEELLDCFDEKHDKVIKNREDLNNIAMKRQEAFDELCNNRGYVPIDDGQNVIPTHPSKVSTEKLLEEVKKGNDHEAITSELEKRGYTKNSDGVWTKQSSQEPKSYDQMDENELFAEYQRLNNEVKYGGLSNSEKVVNINKMKEITARLENKGFRVEGDKIVRNFDGEPIDAHKVTPEERANAKRVIREEKLRRLKEKLGKKLYRSYQAIEKSISKIKTLADFNKIRNYITAKFKDFAEVANDLMNKLIEKAKKLAAFSISKFKISSSGKHFDMKQIHGFINEPYTDPFSLAYSLEQQGFKPTRANSIHMDWKSCVSYYNDKQKILLTYMYDENGKLVSKNMTYANKKADGSYERLSDVIVRYDQYGVPHTVDIDGKKYSVSGGSEENVRGAESANNGSRGENRSQSSNSARDRAYAQYDKNAPLYETPAHGTLNQDLQYLLDVDNLPRLTLCDGTVIDLSNPQIRNKIANLKEGEFITIGREGDIEINASDGVSRHHILITRQNGNIAMKDVSMNGNTTCYTRPKASQQSNRANSGRDRAYSKFDKNARSYEPPRQGILNQNAQYALDLDNMPQLKLCDGTVIDLSHPQIKNKIANLKEGEFITIGRDGDIEINASDMVSRHHILITRHNGRIVMKDVSANGNTTCYTRTKASNQSCGARASRDNAYARFNPRQDAIRTPRDGMLDRTQQYALNINELPHLQLIDGTVVDLNSPEFRNAIANLQEGDFFTIGRVGEADFGVSDSATVSRHHILITRHNGKIVMKDVSSNGKTHCRAKDAEPFGNSQRAQRRAEPPKPEEMTPEQKQARIEKLEAEIRTAPVAQRLKEKFADILDSRYVFRDGDSIDALRRKIRNMSIDAHPDRNGGNISIELQQKINEIKDLLSKDNINYTQVNNKLNELREYIDDLLNVDAKKAEIAKLKKSNGAKSAEEVKPDEQAAYARAAKAEEMKNASADDFQSIISENYNELRHGEYSQEASYGNITEDDLMYSNVSDQSLQKEHSINVYPLDGWYWHSKNGYFSENIKSRISLNVVADKRLLEELDNLLLKGEYTNKYGQKVKIKIPDGSYYKTDTLEGWLTRHDPITMYFTDEISQDLYDAIADISQKYARKGKPLYKSEPDKPWIAADKEYLADDFKALYREALSLNKNLAEAIERAVNGDGDWISSAGNYAACKKLIEDYKATVGV